MMSSPVENRTRPMKIRTLKTLNILLSRCVVNTMDSSYFCVCTIIISTFKLDENY